MQLNLAKSRSASRHDYCIIAKVYNINNGECINHANWGFLNVPLVLREEIPIRELHTIKPTQKAQAGMINIIA